MNGCEIHTTVVQLVECVVNNYTNSFVIATINVLSIKGTKACLLFSSSLLSAFPIGIRKLFQTTAVPRGNTLPFVRLSATCSIWTLFLFTVKWIVTVLTFYLLFLLLWENRLAMTSPKCSQRGLFLKSLKKVELLKPMFFFLYVYTITSTTFLHW